MDPAAPYAFIRVDMRNDWFSRPLRRGSPAGGDRNTLRLGRDRAMPVLTAMPRAESPAALDFAVNTTEVHPEIAGAGADSLLMRFRLTAYAPYLKGYEWSLDGRAYTPIKGDAFELAVSRGRHKLCVRTLTQGGWRGPVKAVDFEVL